MGKTSSLIATCVCLAAPAAWAQSAVLPAQPADDLFGAAFASGPQARSGAALPLPADSLHPLSPPAFMAGAGPMTWSADTVALPGNAGAVRLAVASTPVAPGLTRPNAEQTQQAFDLSYSRGLPWAWKINSGGYQLDVSPHAGFGVSNGGGSAEAGAYLSVEPGKSKTKDDKLAAMGVKDGSAFGDQGRWYLFAAASGRAVGLNMTQGESGWNRAGWSTDRTSALIGDGQLGVGWRQGGMQAAFGYVHREIKVQNSPHGSDNDISDSMAAFSLSFRPTW